MTAPAPIALFAYKRPAHLRRTLEALARNPLAEASDLHVFCDGPKENATAADRAAIEEVRRVAASRKWCGRVEIREQSKNQGLARSIIEGVTGVLQSRDSVIVLEDDIVTSSQFLRFMNEGLQKYAQEDRVASIGAYCYPVKDRLPDTFFLRGADCLGWATWPRAWRRFEPDGVKLLRRIEEAGQSSAFNMDDSFDYTGMLREQTLGQNDSWAIRWHAVNFLAGRLSLYPGVSLIDNIGFDGTGTHCGADGWLKTTASERPLVCGDIPVEESPVGRAAFIRFFREASSGAGRPRGVRRVLSKARSGVGKMLRGLLRGAGEGGGGCGSRVDSGTEPAGKK